jgi:outer membrane receptor protein involved in Fe transport
MVCLAMLGASAPLTQTAASREAAPGSGPSSVASSDEIPEIIVTAQKRSERLLDVPISISTLSASELADAGVRTAAELDKVALGFTYRPSSYGNPIFQIRGIGFFEESIAVPPTVSIYVDQTPVPYSSMSEGASFDIERVEVLKGPQGTLFGENATGGAINYIAAKPTDVLTGGLDVGYGSFDDVVMGGFVSGPLSNEFKARVSFSTEERGDWQKSYGPEELRGAPPRTLGQRDFQAARILLDWSPTQSLRFEFNVNGWIDRSDTQAPQFQRVNLGLPGRVFSTLAALEAWPPPPKDATLAGWAPNVSFRRNDRFYQIALRADDSLSELITLTSITDFTHLDVLRPSDQDGTAVVPANLVIDNYGAVRSFSQELRLAGGRGDNRIRWMAGGNYNHDDSHEVQQIFLHGSNSSVGPVEYDSVALEIYSQPVNAYSAFGSLNYDPVSSVDLYASARYSYQDRHYTGCSAVSNDDSFGQAFGFLSTLLSGTPTPPIPVGACATLGPDGKPVPVLHSTLKEGNVSWRAGVAWKPSDDSLAYANVTKGYKQGTYANEALAFSVGLHPVKAESVLAYEIGFKVQLLDRKVQVTGAVFDMDYDNKQITGTILDPIFGHLTTIVNIPTSRVLGGELELSARPVDGLTIRSGATVVQSKITSSLIAPYPGGPATDHRGESFPGNPKWTFLNDIQYDFPISARLAGLIEANVRYQSDERAYVGYYPYFRLPAYALTDLRAGAHTNEDRYSLQLYIKNVANKYYLIHATNVQDTTIDYTGMPRTYGANFSMRF